MDSALFTKIRGKTPTVKVIMKLIIRAANALSLPSPMEMRMDININNALTKSASPTFLDMTLRFTSVQILLLLLSQLLPHRFNPTTHLGVFLYYFFNIIIKFGKLVVSFKFIIIFLSYSPVNFKP